MKGKHSYDFSDVVVGENILFGGPEDRSKEEFSDSLAQLSKEFTH